MIHLLEYFLLFLILILIFLFVFFCSFVCLFISYKDSNEVLKYYPKHVKTTQNYWYKPKISREEGKNALIHHVFLFLAYFKSN
jgi:heme/copper-type cytochrome/quinol oxidase subunit 2